MMTVLGLSSPLYKVHQVPEHFHEHYIITGYRNPRSSITECFLSIFNANNETLNFWTHFLPSCYFVWVLKNLAEELDFSNDSFSWPLLCYMVASCAFPLASAIAHAFNVMSDNARHICFFVDYGSISVLSFGVAIGYRAYAFPISLRNTFYGHAFLWFAFLNALVGTIVACQTRFMRPGLTRKLMRFGSFAMPYVYDSIPLIYRLVFCRDDVQCGLESHALYARHFLFANISAFLYVTHLPERLRPGMFDIIGHSHQLFHIFAILGAVDQMNGILVDMKSLPAEFAKDIYFPSIFMSIGLMGLLACINVIVIALFTFRLYKLNDLKKKYHSSIASLKVVNGHKKRCKRHA